MTLTKKEMDVVLKWVKENRALGIAVQEAMTPDERAQIKAYSHDPKSSVKPARDKDAPRFRDKATKELYERLKTDAPEGVKSFV